MEKAPGRRMTKLNMVGDSFLRLASSELATAGKKLSPCVDDDDSTTDSDDENFTKPASNKEAFVSGPTVCNTAAVPALR